ncbi:hypothetical protein PSHT_14599 [Puccinia striiformis]|uniref:Uncharacterized protein n=1 Tax=Puccinia striiformis TaxID=27350 RepID=A0A2S4UBY4_9BASI|nr:hypothetical protein PSHT_16017 [Puccinia striiformis]POV97403.1 hypothetical protein PSHT_14599 [Puccinia striiformis]
MFSVRVVSVVMLVSALFCIDSVSSTEVANPPCLGKSGTPYLVCKKATEGYYSGGAACASGETRSCCPKQVPAALSNAVVLC